MNLKNNSGEEGWIRDKKIESGWRNEDRDREMEC